MKKSKQSVDIEQAFRKIKAARDEEIGGEGEAIIVGGMEAQGVYGDMAMAGDEEDYGNFEFVAGHFYMVLEIPVGESFAVKESGGLRGFYTMDKNGVLNGDVQT